MMKIMQISKKQYHESYQIKVGASIFLLILYMLEIFYNRLKYLLFFRHRSISPYTGFAVLIVRHVNVECTLSSTGNYLLKYLYCYNWHCTGIYHEESKVKSISNPMKSRKIPSTKSCIIILKHKHYMSITFIQIVKV